MRRWFFLCDKNAHILKKLYEFCVFGKLFNTSYRLFIPLTVVYFFISSISVWVNSWILESALVERSLSAQIVELLGVSCPVLIAVWALALSPISTSTPLQIRRYWRPLSSYTIPFAVEGSRRMFNEYSLLCHSRSISTFVWGLPHHSTGLGSVYRGWLHQVL